MLPKTLADYPLESVTETYFCQFLTRAANEVCKPLFDDGNFEILCGAPSYNQGSAIISLKGKCKTRGVVIDIRVKLGGRDINMSSDIEIDELDTHEHLSYAGHINQEPLVLIRALGIEAKLEMMLQRPVPEAQRSCLGGCGTPVSS